MNFHLREGTRKRKKMGQYLPWFQQLLLCVWSGLSVRTVQSILVGLKWKILSSLLDYYAWLRAVVIGQWESLTLNVSEFTLEN